MATVKTLLGHVKGDAGVGVPSGGTTGQVLRKKTNANYDTEWANESGAVVSVNGKTGVVVLDAEDVGALPSSTSIPTKTSDITNDSGFITNSYHDATKVDVVQGKGLSTNDYDNTEKGNVASAVSHIANTSNPHSVTKAQVGLGNVPNTDFTARVVALEGKTKLSDFTDDLGSSPTHTHSQYLTSHQDISDKENTSNKVTSISSASTDTQYPSAKCMYDIVGNIESLLEAML